MSKPAEAFEELKTQFLGEIKSLADRVKERDEQLQAHGEATDEVKAAIKAHDERMQEIKGQYEELLGKHEEFVGQVNDLVKKSNRPGAGGPTQRKSLGEVFVESDQYKTAMASNEERTAPVELRSLQPFYEEQKDVTTASGTNDALQSQQRVQGIFGDPARPFRLRDLMVVNQTGEGQVEFVEETGFYQLAAALTSQAAAAQADLVVDNPYGFYDGQTVTIAPGTANEETGVISSIAVATKTITLTANLTNTHAADVRVTAEDFVYTPEAEVMPQADANFDLVTEGMKMLPHFLPITRQALRNQAMLRQHIDTRLLEGLAISEERQILYGDGSSNQLQGILTHSSVQTYLWSNGTVGDSKIDAIRRAITLSQLAHYPLDGIVVHPSDWEDIELEKGSDGHYIWINVGDGGAMRLWRAPVVVTNAIDPGDFCVGAFRLGAALWDRERAQVRVADQHKDYAARNMVLLIAEQEQTLTVYRPESFVYGQFDAEPT